MSIDRTQTNGDVPHYLTRFVGREREIADLQARITASPGARLITLTGVGGCGKTRLAAEVARAFSGRGSSDSKRPVRHRVHWVGLSEVGDAERVPQAVAAALRLREASGRDPLRSLLTALRGTQALLVLDNCEHLIRACRHLVQWLLAGCPDLVILATSRAPLRATDECIVHVPPLETMKPSNGTVGFELVRTEAVRLFLDRAANLLSAYDLTLRNAQAIHRICQCLDGLPLAIELAASWIRVLSAQDILTQLEKSLDLLSSSEPALDRRHRSMRAVLDTSWQSLSNEQQRVFAAMAVFRGSFGREAAELVAGASLPSLAALAENSLLQRLPDTDGATRYHLHAVIRQYAQDRLEAYEDGSHRQAQSRHLRYFLDLAEQAAQTWDTVEEAAWLRRLRPDRGNLRAALRWAIARGRAGAALRLCASLFTFWIYTTPPDEYLELLHHTLALPWDNGCQGVIQARAKTLNVTGYAAVAASDFARAMACFQEGLALYTDLHDAQGIAWSLRGCGFAALLRGEPAEAQSYVERSLTLCRSEGDLWGEAWSVFDLGHITVAQGATEQARALIEDAARRFVERGNLFGAYRALILQGDIQRQQGEYMEALARYGEALELEQESRFGQFGADLLEGLAEVATALRQPGEAAQFFGAGHAWRDAFGQKRSFFHEPGYRQALTVARSQMKADHWSAAYEAGHGWTSEEAIAEAHRAVRSLASSGFTPNPARLTEREVEVLGLLAEGLKDQEIADQLVVSPRTIHAHLRSIYDKLGVRTRTAAAREAADLQLI